MALIHFLTAILLTPSSLAAAVRDSYETVAPVSMFFTKTALELAVAPAAAPAACALATFLK